MLCAGGSSCWLVVWLGSDAIGVCCVQVARVWQRLIQLQEEGGAEQAEQLQLWKEMTQVLQDSVEEQDNETLQHVSA